MDLIGTVGPVYGGGGYAYNLGRRQKSAAEGITYLMNNNWLDKQTRAVFVEFTTFNNQMNLYTVSFIIFEILPTGGLSTVYLCQKQVDSGFCLVDIHVSVFM